MHNPEPLDVPQRVFLFILGALIFLNFIGTTYDVLMGVDAKSKLEIACLLMKKKSIFKIYIMVGPVV